jgi:hypothetical protein
LPCRPHPLEEAITLISAEILTALNAREVIINSGLQVAATARAPLKNKHFQSPIITAIDRLDRTFVTNRK